ncbi:MAG: hypothetical protein FWB83_11640 [Treponema sp.]|nr:hypothetical protein [Treponema sp.]
MNVKLNFLIIIFLLASGGIFAQESDDDTDEDPQSSEVDEHSPFLDFLPFTITSLELEAYLRGEHNRNFQYSGDFSVTGLIELENIFSLKCGLSAGTLVKSYYFNTFVSPSISPFTGLPLSFTLSYIYNGLLDYNVHTHTLLPYISFNGRTAGVSLGMNFRFTNFMGTDVIFESILSFNAYLNIYNSSAMIIGISMGNFSDFYEENLNAYSYIFYAVIRLDARWSILSGIELMQSGIDGLTTTFYGFSWRTGVRLTW